MGRWGGVAYNMITPSEGALAVSPSETPLARRVHGSVSVDRMILSRGMAWNAAFGSIGGRWPIGPNRRLFLDHQTHLGAASSRSCIPCHGPSCRTNRAR